jgi:hypothetical protein
LCPAVQCESESLLNTTEELQVALRYLRVCDPSQYVATALQLLD